MKPAANSLLFITFLCKCNGRGQPATHQRYIIPHSCQCMADAFHTLVVSKIIRYRKYDSFQYFGFKKKRSCKYVKPYS